MLVTQVGSCAISRKLVLLDMTLQNPDESSTYSASFNGMFGQNSRFAVDITTTMQLTKYIIFRRMYIYIHMYRYAKENSAILFFTIL